MRGDVGRHSYVPPSPSSGGREPLGAGGKGGRGWSPGQGGEVGEIAGVREW